MFLFAVRFFKKTIIGSDKGISIVLAIIIIIVLGLAGSIFAYLTSSGNITSRSNLTSAAAKYAAKSGVEITMYEIEQPGNNFSPTPPPGSDCPSPVLPPGVTGSLSNISYLSGNLQGNMSTSSEYTPTFCAVKGKLKGGGNCTYYIITSNGFADGTEREVTAEVGIGGGNCTGIYVETELPNGQ